MKIITFWICWYLTNLIFLEIYKMKITFILLTTLYLTACVSKTLPQENPAQYKPMDRSCERQFPMPSAKDPKYWQKINEYNINTSHCKP